MKTMLTPRDKTDIVVLVEEIVDRKLVAERQVTEDMVDRKLGTVIEHFDDKFARMAEAIGSRFEKLENMISESLERTKIWEKEMAFMRGDIHLHEKRIIKLETGQ